MNARSLYKPGTLKALIPQLQQYKIHILHYIVVKKKVDMNRELHLWWITLLRIIH
jgi:hypothetical protein